MNNSYHLNVEISKRSKGCSSLKTGAYLAGLKLTDGMTGETHDYSNRDDVDFVDIFSPVKLPEYLKTPEGFCEAIEKREKRKDSQLFRHFNVAIPRELPRDEKIKVGILFCQFAFVSRGMCCMLAIHGVDSDNPHFHVIVTMRRFDPKIGDFGEKDRGWNKKPILKSQRKEWEKVCNEALVEMGRPDLKVSCESYEARGITKPRQKHMGSYVHKLWVENGIILEKSAQYVLDTETKNLENTNKEIELVESEIVALTLKNDKQLAEVILTQIPDFTGISKVPAQQSQPKPAVVPAFITPSQSDVYSGPIFDLSKIYIPGFEPKPVRHKPAFECNFDEEMRLKPSVPIVRVGLTSKKPEMTLKERIQQYIDNHWDLREILPISIIVELGLQDVMVDILVIRGEKSKDLGFSSWDIPDDEFAETCESNLITDKHGKRLLKRDLNDLYLDYVPDEDFTPPPTPSPKSNQSQSHGMSP